MHKLQVLTEMVLSVEGPVAGRPLLACRVVMAVDVCLVWVSLATEDAANLLCVGVKTGWPLWRADPSLEREMQRLLVSLPVMLRSESLGTKGTLESLQ